MASPLIGETPDHTSRFMVAAAAISLVLGIAILFLHPADEYFLGDSIALLIARPPTWSAALRDLARLGGTHWYRPLSNGWLPLLLWPHWRLDFQPYHQLALVLHSGFSVGLFLWLRQLLHDTRAAWIGAAFFAFHPIQFYATYDHTFYQEPVAAAFLLAAIACLYFYARNENGKSLAGGLLCFVLALLSRENSAVLPVLFAIVVWRAGNVRRAAIALGASAAIGVAFTAWYKWYLHPLRYQPESYWPDSSPVHWTQNLFIALRWAFGVPVGEATQGWQSPIVVQALLGLWLGIALLALVAMGRHHLEMPKGAAWFAVAGAAAFSTHHLAPHHIYLALIGIALWIGGMFAAWSRDQRPRWIASAIAAVLLTGVFVTSLISARFDSVNSWLGKSSWDTRMPALYTRSALRDLSRARGILVYTSDADLSFSWESGNVFRLLAGDPLEARLVRERPASAPAGILVFEYRDRMLRPLALPVSTAATPPTVDVRVEPTRVPPGTSYRLEAPQLAGQWVDLRYSYNDRLPTVAYSFARLDPQGAVTIPCPANIPWGTVEVLGVRAVGAAEWSPARLRVEVLHD